MRALRTILSLLLAMSLWGCDVHEWPVPPAVERCRLRLTYELDMTLWDYSYDGEEVEELGERGTYSNVLHQGIIGYLIHAYPIVEGERAAEPAHRFHLTKSLTEGYDHEVVIELPAGEWELMVWSDLRDHKSSPPYYIADNFAAIEIAPPYRGDTNYRDAFGGCGTLTLKSDIEASSPVELTIPMKRPLAKYEVVAQDVAEFIQKEQIRLYNKVMEGQQSAPIDPSAINIDLRNYRVIFYYVGYMHDTYSLPDDKPIDSATGVWFETSLERLSDQSASLGFDYAFVNGKPSRVTVQIGIYDNQGEQLSLTDPIKVPVLRGRHSVLRGSFLMSNASGGLHIDPDFEGDHNIDIP